MAEAENTVDVEALTQTVEGEAPPIDSTPADDSAAPDEDSGIDWGGLTSEVEQQTYDEYEDPEPEETPEPETPETEAQTSEPEPAPEPEPEVPPEPEPVVPEPEPVAAEAPEEPTPPQEPEQPQAPVVSDEEVAKLRERYVDDLSNRYKMSEEDSDKFLTDVNSVLPRLAAEMHANVVQEVTQMFTNSLQTMLPPMMEQYTTQRETRQRGEQEFYGQWPELKGHEDRVRQIVSSYRQLNPQANREQVFRDAGIQAWMAVGLDPASLAAKLTPEPEPTPQPVAPPPPAPANPGGTNVAPPAPNLNQFEALSFEFEEDFD